MHFSAFPQPDGSANVGAAMSNEEIVALGREYDKLMNRDDRELLYRGDTITMLTLARGILDRTIWRHPEEHELPKREANGTVSFLTPDGQIIL